MGIRCPTCDTENADNGAFCIECGTSLRAVAVGSTERLPGAGDGKRCTVCDTPNPIQARFCVNCGQALAVSPQSTATAAPRTYTMPPEPAPLTAPRIRAGPMIGRNRAAWGGMSGGVFLIGLAVLFATGTIWPGILALLGVMALLGATIGGEPQSGMVGAIFLIGMAFLFATGLFWPGILVLLGITAILGTATGVSRRRP